MASPSTSRARVRSVLPGLDYGKHPPGPLNSITDVPGVLVHTKSIQPDANVNTGVTTILPRADWHRYCSFAGIFRFNGCGEMTASHCVEETGLLTSPIILTTTSALGDAYRGIMQYCYENHSDDQGEMDLFVFPLVAETFDGFLSDQSRFAVSPEHIMDGIRSATNDAVPEGNTGGGTGMICHRVKGGTGSSSRELRGVDVESAHVTYTVGVLVQANYGSAEDLHIGGVPVGKVFQAEDNATTDEKKAGKEPRKDGSIIVVIATDVPLLPVQLQRLAKRATVGLAKVGGYGSNTSGDIFLAFSTANQVPFQEVSMSEGNAVDIDPSWPQPRQVQMVDNDTINGVFETVAEATEEAIYNSLFMAESMTGFRERRVGALDLRRVKEMVERRL